MNQKIEQNLILKSIKQELANNNNQQNVQDENQSLKQNEIQTFEIESEDSFEDSFLEIDEKVNKVHNSFENFGIFQDPLLQTRYAINNNATYREIVKNQKLYQKQQILLKKETKLEQNFEDYNLNLSRRDYVKNMLDPDFMEKKKQKDLVKKRQQEEKMAQQMLEQKKIIKLSKKEEKILTRERAQERKRQKILMKQKKKEYEEKLLNSDIKVIPIGEILQDIKKEEDIIKRNNSQAKIEEENGDIKQEEDYEEDGDDEDDEEEEDEEQEDGIQNIKLDDLFEDVDLDIMDLDEENKKEIEKNDQDTPKQTQNEKSNINYDIVIDENETQDDKDNSNSNKRKRDTEQINEEQNNNEVKVEEKQLDVKSEIVQKKVKQQQQKDDEKEDEQQQQDQQESTNIEEKDLNLKKKKSKKEKKIIKKEEENQQKNEIKIEEDLIKIEEKEQGENINNNSQNLQKDNDQKQENNIKVENEENNNNNNGKLQVLSNKNNNNSEKKQRKKEKKKKALSIEEKIKISQEKHNNRVKQLDQLQYFQYRFFSCIDTYKDVKNQFLDSIEDNNYAGSVVGQNQYLLDRNYFLRHKKDSLFLKQAEQQNYQQKKQRENGQGEGTMFELKIEIDQKQRKIKKHQDFLKILAQHHTQFFEFHKRVRKNSRKLVIQAKTIQELRDLKRKKIMDNESKNKLQLLRDSNMEQYLDMIKNSKSTRIQELLKQTDNFLRQLGGKVMLQKGDKIEDNLDEEMNFGTQSDDYIQNFIKSNKVYYNLTHSVKEQITKQPEILQNGKLKSYQLIGLQWMISLYNNKLNGILADEMGLGKTIQTISLFSYLIETKKVYGPFMVVVPLSTISNWQLEFDKWAPSIKYVMYKGGPTVRKENAKWMKVNNWHICLTTYDYVLKDKSVLSKWNWKYIVIDEGHRMKNNRSKFAQILGQQYISEYRLLLTGTPLQNNLAELWALLNFLLPKIFESCDDFEKWFSLPLGKSAANKEEAELSEEESLLIINRLHQVLRPFLLRRVKKEVEAELPSKVEQVIKVDLTPWQKMYYDQLEQKKQVCQDPNTGKVQFSMLNNLVMQLRKICNHPFLFLNDFMINDDLWRMSGKMELLDRMLPKLLNTKHRILIFTQMTQVMDIMQFYFQIKNIKFLRLDGSTKSEERGESQRLFNMENSEYNVFILSTRAGGLGLNLQSADTVIIYDSDWNPQQDLQAQDRAHRIGSKREVRVFRLVTANSIEESILEKARYKMGLDEMIIQAGLYNQKSSQDERNKQIENLLQRNKNDNDEIDNIPNDEQINEIISRSDQEIEIFTQMDKERYEIEKQQFNNFTYPTIIQDGEEVQNPDWLNYRYGTEDEIPEWIRAPPSKSKNGEWDEEVQSGGRQRKVVNYNEKMSHVEFMRYIGEFKEKPQKKGETDGNNEDKMKIYEDEEEEYLQQIQDNQQNLRKKNKNSDEIFYEDDEDYNHTNNNNSKNKQKGMDLDDFMDFENGKTEQEEQNNNNSNSNGNKIVLFNNNSSKNIEQLDIQSEQQQSSRSNSRRQSSRNTNSRYSNTNQIDDTKFKLSKKNSTSKVIQKKKKKQNNNNMEQEENYDNQEEEQEQEELFQEDEDDYDSDVGVNKNKKKNDEEFMLQEEIFQDSEDNGNKNQGDDSDEIFMDD